VDLVHLEWTCILINVNLTILTFSAVGSVAARCNALTSARRARAQFGGGTPARCDVLGDVVAHRMIIGISAVCAYCKMSWHSCFALELHPTTR